MMSKAFSILLRAARVCYIALFAVFAGLLPVAFARPDRVAAMGWGTFVVAIGAIFILRRQTIGQFFYRWRIWLQRQTSELEFIEQARRFGMNLILVGSVTLAGTWLWGGRVSAIEANIPVDAAGRLESIFFDLPSTMNEEALTNLDFEVLGQKVVEADEAANQMRQSDIPSLVRLLCNSSSNIWARGQAINAVRTIQIRLDRRWKVAPDLDYDGLIRLASDKTDDHSLRCDAVELLGRWRHRAAAAVFRRILIDPSEDASVKRCAIRFHGMVDSDATELPDAFFETSMPKDLRLDWFSFADNATLSETSIRRMSVLIWDADRGVSNRALQAIGAQNSGIVVDILGPALVTVARRRNLHSVSNSEIVQHLLSRSDTRSVRAVENAIDAAAESGNLNVIEEIITVAAELEHPLTDQFVEDSIRALARDGGPGFDEADFRTRLQEARQFGQFSREYHRTGVAKEDGESFENYFRRAATLGNR